MNEIVIRIEGLDRLTEALQALQTLRALAGSQTTREPQQAPNGQRPITPAPVPGTQLQQPAFPGQIPVQPMAPAQMPMPGPAPQRPAVPTQGPVGSATQQPAAPSQTLAAPAPASPAPAAQAPAPQIPTTAAPQQYDFDQLAVALANVCMLPDGQAKVQALLQQFGVNALFDLPKSRFGEFATALRGIGGVI